MSMSGWHESSGGPFVSAGNLMENLVDLGHDVTFFTGDYGEPSPASAPLGVKMITAKGLLLPVIRQTLTPGAYPTLLSHCEAQGVDVFHDNGLWRSLNIAVARVAHAKNIPRIVSLRGTLDSHALSHRGWKKRIALSLGHRRALEQATCLHATSLREVDSIRSFGLKQPIALISNGVGFPSEAAHFSETEPRTALYLGRLHPIKNLEVLVRAWARIAPPNWRLKIVGNAEMGYDRHLQSTIRDERAEKQIEIGQPVYGSEKSNLLRSAQLFFLVSKTENFGISAAEALAHGLPVVASTATPWSCLPEIGAGWSIEGVEESLAETIRIATSLPSSELQAMGQRGRNYAKDSLSWSKVAYRFAQTYNWLIGAGEQPDFIQ